MIYEEPFTLLVIIIRVYLPSLGGASFQPVSLTSSARGKYFTDYRYRFINSIILGGIFKFSQPLITNLSYEEHKFSKLKKNEFDKYVALLNQRNIVG